MYLPAYAALALALGAALYALTGTIGDIGFSWKIWFVFVLGLVFSGAARCQESALRHLCGWLMMLFVMVMPPLSLVSSAFAPMPSEAMGDNNTFVTVLMAWIALVSTFAVGMRHSGRFVPFAVPLVPTLSLFGLLNTISVNSVVGMAFLVFVASSIYLVAYERWLAIHPENANSSTVDFDRTLPRHTGEKGSLSDSNRSLVGWRQTANGYVLACAAWFALFLGGAALLYVPFTAIVPTSLPASISAASLYMQREIGGWHQSPPIMELRGGHYSLSQREIARITIQSGKPSGLWRGHIYETYSESRWRQSPREVDVRVVSTAGDSSVSLRNGRIPANSYTFALPPSSTSSRSSPSGPKGPNPNSAGCTGNNCEVTVESVAPLQATTSSLHASGQPFAVQGDLGEVQIQANGTVNIEEAMRYAKPYTVRSRVNAPDMRALNSARGLSNDEQLDWLRDPRTSVTLSIQRDFSQQRELLQIAQDIEHEAALAGKKLDSPARRVQAVSNYLARHCLYSLQAPVVPSDSDSVLFFLQTSRTGACDMFASSAALLLRAMGIPTRLASGYIQPEDAASGGVYTVRELDAHAWIEYYVPSLGWIAHDPTRGVRTVEESALTSFLPWSNNSRLALLWLPAGALLAVVLVAKRRRPKRVALVIRNEDTPDRARIRACYERALHLMQRRIPRPPCATPEEYENAVMRSRLPHDVKLEFTALTYLFAQSQFASPALATDEALMRDCLARLKRALRRAPRKL
ncbi:MAG TPA: transglutaminase-like domain-containing protein [Abditibacteriaceae bacterium]|jgi:transglutaminase-like putative cysteine protease